MIGLLSMQKVNSSFLLKVLPRAFLIFLVCLSLVAFTSYTAPKAQAEAVSLSLTTAFLMLAIAVMSTLGVTLTASSNQDAIDYIHDPFLSFLQGKGFSSISDYLASVGITAITQLCIPVFGAVNIVKTVYDIIAEFCSSFFADNNVVSGGSNVGQAPTVQYPPLSIRNGISESFSLNSNIRSPWNTVRMSASNFYFYFTNGSYIRWNNNGTTTIERLIFVNASGHTVATATTNGTGAWYYGSPALSLSGDNVIIRFLYRGSYNGGNSLAMGNITLSATEFYSIVNEEQPTTSGGFLISPSATVLSPPQVATGQTYSIPATGVQSDDNIEDAIPALVAPLTTTAGLSNTGTVAGTAVQSEWKWLYEDTQSIRNNTNPHFDFIPGSLGFDFSIWHYVVAMMNSVNSSIALFGTFVQNMPPAILVFPFGVFALCITVALFRRFLS